MNKDWHNINSKVLLLGDLSEKTRGCMWQPRNPQWPQKRTQLKLQIQGIPQRNSVIATI